MKGYGGKVRGVGAYGDGLSEGGMRKGNMGGGGWKGNILVREG
jgi:hypothetical protein